MNNDNCQMLCTFSTTIQCRNLTMDKQLKSQTGALEVWIYRRISHSLLKQKQLKYKDPIEAGNEKRNYKRNKTRQVKYCGHIKRYNTLIKGKLMSVRVYNQARDRLLEKHLPSMCRCHLFDLVNNSALESTITP